MAVELYGVAETLYEDTEENRKAYEIASTALTDAMKLFDSADYKSKEGWKKEVADKGDVVYSKHLSFGKLFALSGELDCPAEKIVKDNWENQAELPTWNTNVETAREVLKLGSQSDIAYQAMNDMMLVKGRDFVGGRIWRKIDDYYVISGRSVQSSKVQSIKGKVRASMNLGAGKFSPKPGDPSKTQLEYLASLDFAGMIPKAVINAVMAKLLITDIQMLQKHAIVVRDTP